MLQIPCQHIPQKSFNRAMYLVIQSTITSHHRIIQVLTVTTTITSTRRLYQVPQTTITLHPHCIHFLVKKYCPLRCHHHRVMVHLLRVAPFRILPLLLIWALLDRLRSRHHSPQRILVLHRQTMSIVPHLVVLDQC